MAELTPSVLASPQFDPGELKVAQLRGLLLEYNVTYPATAKKADLVYLFETQVRNQAIALAVRNARIAPSTKGITVVPSETSDSPPPPSTAGTKRARQPSKKSMSAEVDAIVLDDAVIQELDVAVGTAPPAKKAKGRPKRQTEGIEVDVVVPVSVAKVVRGRGRGKSSISVQESEQQDVGTEGEVEDETTPAPRTRRSRASVPISESSTPAPSLPSSSRRRTIQPPSSSTSFEVATPRSQVARRPEPDIQQLTEVREESEKEDDPTQKVTKSGRKVKTPRKSGEESAFSDYNPFQSGSEEAAERERRRRKSSFGTTPRPKTPKPRQSEPVRSAYTPITPAITPPPILRRVGPSRENLKTPPKDVRDAIVAEKELKSAQSHNEAVHAKLNQITSTGTAGESSTSLVRVEKTEIQPSTSLVKRVSDNLHVVPAVKPILPLSVLFLLLLSLLANFKSQSSSIGFCDPASKTNNLIIRQQSAIDDTNACLERKSITELERPGSASNIHCDVSSLPLIPFLPRASRCTPCPPHAICSEGELIACEAEYILNPHPLSVLAPALDGVPGMGPRALVPSCRPDTAKKRMVGGLAKEIEGDLARGRGMVVCSGLDRHVKDERRLEGAIYGMEEGTLRENYAARRDPRISEEQYNEIYEAAINDLVAHEDIVESIDVLGKTWYAAKRTELTVSCRARMEAFSLLDQWKSQLGSTAAVLAAIAYLRSTMKNRRQEKYKVEELVRVALKRLQDQERLHYSDPVTTPNPFIPPAQLRDLVMPPKGTTSSRTRLWSAVQDLVEANANVAVREQEVRGEVWKTWEWQGVGERHVTWGDA